jgi:hypothetical protein
VSSLQNWTDGTGCISANETEYLHHKSGLIGLGSSSDSAGKQLEDWVEDLVIHRYKGFRAVLEAFPAKYMKNSI